MVSLHVFLGTALVLLATVAASTGSVLGFAAGYRLDARALKWTRISAYVFAISMLLANLVMVRALLMHDFSVSYVAQVGSLASPTHITIVSLWSSLEGSILFWGAVLASYLLVFLRAYDGRFAHYTGYALGVFLFVAAFFAFLIAGPADPFVTMNPVPLDGPGPNPLLQNHPLMIIHPPTLYVGYVGMTVPFSIAIAALLRGELSAGWLKVLRQWTLFPWAFLSCGIVLGGWWAYEVLGWGGYWAWDPVENASFLPWLAATTYLHSTVVQERRKTLKAWTMTLVISAFLLTILGTFMTRSGVFNSVHSFTQSSIGPMFLVFLAICLVGGLGLLAGRAHLLESEGKIESLVSREGAFLVNNLVFSVFTFTVLLGTLFPLIVEAFTAKKISVGEPYFNKMAIPIGLSLLFLMGVGPSLPWGRAKLSEVVKLIGVPTLLGFMVAVVCLILGVKEPLALLTFGLAAFAGFVTVREILAPALERATRRQESFLTAFVATSTGNRRRLGGFVVHMGVIIMAVAISASSTYRIEAEASLGQGMAMELGEYSIRYEKPKSFQESHREVFGAEVSLFRDEKLVAKGFPRMSFYATQREPIFSPHVLSFATHDVYLSLVGFDPKEGRASLKAYRIPLVAWLWWGMPLLVLGSVIGLWPRRQRRLAPRLEEATAP